MIPSLHHWFKIQKAFHLTPLEDFGPQASSHLSIVREHPNCGFKPLNQYQEEAVKEALGKPFTLVQGPPGKPFFFSVYFKVFFLIF